MKVFKAGEPPYKTTMARQVFKKNLTDLNDAFWILAISQDHLISGYENIGNPTKAPNIRNFLRSPTDWTRGVSTLRSWARQNVIVSAASILESYVASAATVTFSACPEIIDCGYKGLDSTTWIKWPEDAPKEFKKLRKSITDDLTKGEWKERFSKVRRRFGKLPEDLIDMTEDLQKLQSRRNDIAHEFGSLNADGELRRTPWDMAADYSVSDDEFINMMKLIDRTCKLFDLHVFSPHIGSFEILYEYSTWTPTPSPNRASSYRSTEFRKHLGRNFSPLPTSYIIGMIEYYDSVTRDTQLNNT